MGHGWKPLPTLGLKGKGEEIILQKPLRVGTMEEETPRRSCGHVETQPQPEPRHKAGWNREEISQALLLFMFCGLMLVPPFS